MEINLLWMISSCLCFYLIWKIQGFYIPQRYWLTFMGFLGLVMAYSMRLSLSVAITQMVPPPIITALNLTKSNGETETICPYDDINYKLEHLDYQNIFDMLYSVNETPNFLYFMCFQTHFQWLAIICNPIIWFLFLNEYNLLLLLSGCHRNGYQWNIFQSNQHLDFFFTFCTKREREIAG